jgi:hypothetical protein
MFDSLAEAKSANAVSFDWTATSVIASVYNTPRLVCLVEANQQDWYRREIEWILAIDLGVVREPQAWIPQEFK